MLDRLFVYGTLRRTGDRIHPLLRTECSFLSMATYQGILYDFGPYPGVVASSNADDAVVGELYRIGANVAGVLARLDAYEGTAYERVGVEVRCEDGEDRTGWIYLYKKSLDEAIRVQSGDYHAP